MVSVLGAIMLKRRPRYVHTSEEHVYIDVGDTCETGGMSGRLRTTLSRHLFNLLSN